MAIYTDRLIFYHIPKTGGSWVYDALRSAGVVYRDTGGSFYGLPAHAAPGSVPPEIKGRFAFCFVRHPLDWYSSYWRFLRQSGAKFLINKRIEPSIDGDYDASVNRMIDRYPDGFVTWLYGLYTDQVDFIGRTESLEDDLIRALQLAGEDFDERKLRATGRVNVSTPIPAVLTDATRRRVLSAERRVIEEFYGLG